MRPLSVQLKCHSKQVFPPGYPDGHGTVMFIIVLLKEYGHIVNSRHTLRVVMAAADSDPPGARLCWSFAGVEPFIICPAAHFGTSL